MRKRRLDKMSEVLLITGGARSGKSLYAEKLAAAEGGDVLYIATATACDEEMEERIAFHRKNRPDNWTTWERYYGLAGIENEFDMNAYNTIILDCVGNLLMGILYEEVPDEDKFTIENFVHVVKASLAEINALCSYATKNDKTLVIVTNEIGMGIVPDTRYARYFRDALGHINKHIARLSDKVVLMVAGIPITIK